MTVTRPVHRPPVPGAKRAIEGDLPEAVAAAVVDLRYGPLAENPHRVGKPLRFQLVG